MTGLARGRLARPGRQGGGAGRRIPRLQGPSRRGAAGARDGLLIPHRRRPGSEGQPARHPVRRGGPRHRPGGGVAVRQLGLGTAGSISGSGALGATAGGAGRDLFGHHADVERRQRRRLGRPIALAEILGNGDKAEDLLFFGSAGNTAQRHWGGRFRDSGDGWHEWAPGRIDNRILPWDGERPSVEMCWSPGAAYELSVMDLTAGREIGLGQTVAGDGHSCAAVRFEPQAGHAYAARVRLVGGTPGVFHLIPFLKRIGGAAPASSDAVFPGDSPGDRREARGSTAGGWITGAAGLAVLAKRLAAVVPFPVYSREALCGHVRCG